ncbi:hypothetical protein GCM10025868_33710 [Angustibacter aerolatus]|uniref:Gfo/Idh/MocA-like oxidoreductase N-terminal domain-containing protein n=1 Tax=Angustibacter aerolatus TaxID=1162965 RepID=A0ABQ6JIP1_9ACTN|nr:hypothetical protein GCM10025868_33710 [Angustibacter aerolatus]
MPDVAGLVAAGVEALVIAAATDAHAALVLAGVDAGLPVFCEKPVAADLAGTLLVRDRVAAAGALVHVGFQRRFDAGYTAAREALRAGRLGEPATRAPGHLRPQAAGGAVRPAQRRHLPRHAHPRLRRAALGHRSRGGRGVRRGRGARARGLRGVR